MSFSSWGDSPVRLRRAYSSRVPAVAEITGRDPSISTSFNVVRSFGTNTLVLSKWLIIGVTQNSAEWNDCSLRWKRPWSSLAQRIRRRGNHSVPWIYESSLMIQEMPKPTAQKAACIACNLKQGRQLRQLRRDEQGPWVRRFSKYLWETFSRVRSRKAAGQTLISSSVLHAYA